MSVEEIQADWSKHESTPFPLGHRTKEFNGMSLTAIESEVGGYIMTFVQTGGRLGARQYNMLTKFHKELPGVIAELEGEGKQYFESLYEIVKKVKKICPDPESDSA